jgi:hypothetical protein
MKRAYSRKTAAAGRNTGSMTVGFPALFFLPHLFGHGDEGAHFGRDESLRGIDERDWTAAAVPSRSMAAILH